MTTDLIRDTTNTPSTSPVPRLWGDAPLGSTSYVHRILFRNIHQDGLPEFFVCLRKQSEYLGVALRQQSR